MTATEKLKAFALAVRTARDLRRQPVHQRGKNWSADLRAANLAVDEHLAEHLADEQPADEQPDEQPRGAADEVKLPAHPPAAIGAATGSRAEKPHPRKRGGQHND